MNKIGERIKQARIIKKLTQAELAKKLSKSSQVISNWERGYTNPSYEDIDLLASTLDVPSAYLLGIHKDIHPTEPSKIGERIKFIRTKKKLTQAELAKKINKSAQAISNWEKGYSMPDGKDLIQLASAFDVTTKYLFGIDSDSIHINDDILIDFPNNFADSPFISIVNPNYLTDSQFFEFFMFLMSFFPRTPVKVQSFLIDDLENLSFLTDSMKDDLRVSLQELSSLLISAPQLVKENIGDDIKHELNQTFEKLKKQLEDN